MVKCVLKLAVYILALLLSGHAPFNSFLFLRVSMQMIV